MDPGAIAELLARAAERLGAVLAFDPALLLAPEMLARLGVQVLLLGGSAFFSGSETALFGLSRVDLQQLRRQRHPHAPALHALLDEPRRLIVSILCGNELVNIAAITNLTAILVVLYGEARAGWLTVVLMLPLLLLVGEVTPKTIAVSNPRRISASLVARPMALWIRAVAPLRWLIRGVSERITTWIVGAGRAPEHLLQVDEFRSLVEDYGESGRIEASSRVLIRNLLAAGTTEIVAIMTPRSRTDFLDGDRPASQILEAFRELRHWRVPVYRGHRDQLVGFLHAEDVLRLCLDGGEPDAAALEGVLRPVVAVPLTKKVDEMFDFFVRNDARAAVILNEFGGVAGLVTIEDVLRFIFGPLIARPERSRVEEVAPGAWEARGDTTLVEFNRVTNLGLADPRMTTLGGVAFRQLDRLPRVGDTARLEGLILTVLEMDAHRIARVRVSRGEGAPAGPDDAATEAAGPVSGEGPT